MRTDVEIHQHDECSGDEYARTHGYTDANKYVNTANDNVYHHAHKLER